MAPCPSGGDGGAALGQDPNGVPHWLLVVWGRIQNGVTPVLAETPVFRGWAEAS